MKLGDFLMGVGGVRSLGQSLQRALPTLDSTCLEASANIPVLGRNTREIPPRSECQIKGAILSTSSIAALSQQSTAVMGPSEEPKQLWGLQPVPAFLWDLNFSVIWAGAPFSVTLLKSHGLCVHSPLLLTASGAPTRAPASSKILEVLLP